MSMNSSTGYPLEDTQKDEYLLSPSLDFEELRQISPSRIAYHISLVRKSGKLPLSKEIGLLLWLNDHDLLTEWGGCRRLIKLQKRASQEAILSALSFRRLLNQNVKRQHDFFHHAVVLNSPLLEVFPTLREKRRVGIGYRDKGTLPNPSRRARRIADSSVWYFIADIGQEFADGFPIEGDWVDLGKVLTQEYPDTS